MAYYVYLLASRRHGTLCLGVTSNLARRVHEYKTKTVPGFTSHYSVDRLVWFETYHEPCAAIAREKMLRKCRRDFTINLIEDQKSRLGRPL